MKCILYKDHEDMGPVYLSVFTAVNLKSYGNKFRDFLDSIIERCSKGDADEEVTIKDNERGETVQEKGFARNGYRFENVTFVLEKLYDRSVVFHFREMKTLVNCEEEQAEIRDICERDFDRLYDKALEIAERAHAGQTDKAGKPYIDHPKYVAEHVDGKVEKITALLHDVIEDSDTTLDDLSEFPCVIRDAVRLLTRGKNENYADYIIDLRENPIARRVKIEDMKHNMDISRIPDASEDDMKRVEKYSKYLELLQNDYVNEDLACDCDDNIRMVEFQQNGYNFHAAMEYAVKADKERIAKAAEVVEILNQMGADINTRIAALLYCTVTMEDLNMAGIDRVFGMEVSTKYMYLPWNYDVVLDDKMKMVEAFFNRGDASPGQKQIMLAVAIAELRALERKVYREGRDSVFSSEEEKLQKEQYYNILTNGFDEFEHDNEMEMYYWMLQNLFKDVFVKYHISETFDEIYQGCDLYCFVFHRGGEDWEEIRPGDVPLHRCKEITREEAESLSDDWIDEAVEKKNIMSGEHGLS